MRCPAAERLTCRLLRRRLQDVGPVHELQTPNTAASFSSSSSHCGLGQWKRDAAGWWRRSRRSSADAAADTWNGSLFSFYLLTQFVGAICWIASGKSSLNPSKCVTMFSVKDNEWVPGRRLFNNWLYYMKNPNRPFEFYYNSRKRTTSFNWTCRIALQRSALWVTQHQPLWNLRRENLLVIRLWVSKLTYGQTKVYCNCCEN